MKFLKKESLHFMCFFFHFTRRLFIIMYAKSYYFMCAVHFHFSIFFPSKNLTIYYFENYTALCFILQVFSPSNTVLPVSFYVQIMCEWKTKIFFIQNASFFLPFKVSSLASFVFFCLSTRKLMLKIIVSDRWEIVELKYFVLFFPFPLV